VRRPSELKMANLTNVVALRPPGVIRHELATIESRLARLSSERADAAAKRVLRSAYQRRVWLLRDELIIARRTG
jgi:hypothetical protein